MRVFKNLSVLAVLVCVCDARPTSSVVFEKVESSPAGWVLDKTIKVDKDATSITLKIHLVNQDMDKFHKLATDVSRACANPAILAMLTERADCDAWQPAIRQPFGP